MMKSLRFPSAVLVVVALVSVQGCDGGPDGPSPSAPVPAHPAMSGPVSGSTGGAAMPPGHPAIAGGGPALEQPGALPPDHPPLSEPAAAPAGSPPGGRQVSVGPLTITAPEGWGRQAVTPSQFAPLAAFTLPKAEGDAEDGRLTVSQTGGGVEANIARWQAQFKENLPPQTEAREVAGMKVTVVHLAGTLSGGRGPMATGADKPNSKMWGAVIEAPETGQLLFLKATGPAKTMDRWDGSFVEFLGTLRKGP